MFRLYENVLDKNERSDYTIFTRKEVRYNIILNLRCFISLSISNNLIPREETDERYREIKRSHKCY